MVRKSLFFIATVIATGYIGYQIAWHPDSMPGGADVGTSLLAIAVGVLALAFLAWAVASASPAKTIGAFVLGIVSAKLGDDLWSSISLGDIGVLVAVLIGLVVLYAGTVLDGTNNTGSSTGLRQRIKDKL